MEYAVMVALGLHAATILPLNADNVLSFFYLKLPAVFSLMLLAVMVADKV